jgi:hypothetical protein
MIAHEAVSRSPPNSLSMIVARTKGYTYAAKVWEVSLVQAPSFCRPVPNLSVTIRNCCIACRSGSEPQKRTASSWSIPLLPRCLRSPRGVPSPSLPPPATVKSSCCGCSSSPPSLLPLAPHLRITWLPHGSGSWLVGVLQAGGSGQAVHGEPPNTPTAIDADPLHTPPEGRKLTFSSLSS